MWNKVARLASPGGPRRASRSQQQQQDLPLAKFTQAWETLTATLSSTTSLNATKTSQIESLLNQLISLLSFELRESKTPGSLGVCLEFVLEHQIVAHLVAATENDEPSGVRLLVIHFIANLMSIDQGILVHAAINKPLVKLLRTCIDQQNELMRDEEEAVVEVMCLVCCRLKTAPQLLPIFLRERSPSSSTNRKSLQASLAAAAASFALDDDASPARPLSPTPSTSSAQTHSHTAFSVTSSSAARPRGQSDFLLFTYLLRFVHREGKVGDFAREGLLHLVDIATALPSSPYASLDTSGILAKGMTRIDTGSTITAHAAAVVPTPSRAAREATLAFSEHLLDSDFAEVLGAGLGALYGLLPTKLVVRGPDSRTRASEWDDELVYPGKVSQGGGMVLGGMGPLGENDDPEEVERQREDEEDRLRGMGFGLTGTDEFREGLDAYLTLVEFTQEVLGRCKVVEEALQPEEDEDEVDDEARQQRFVMTALSASILTSLRSSLLENVVYPSVLECSEADGSAVAVMSYIEAMLEVVHEGTDFEAVVLGFLMGEEDARDLAQRQRMANLAGSRLASSTTKKAPSSALVLLQNTSASLNGMRGDGSSSYYTSLGRFTLKDLLVSHVHSTSAPTATAALKLLHTLLVSHDRWSLGLLDIVLDESATSFPIPLREEIEEDDESDEDAPFVYPGAEDDDDSDDEFVYPGASESKATLTPAKVTGTPSKLPTISIGTPIAPTVSVKAHQSGLDALLSLVGNIDPAYRRARSVGGASEILSTGFSNYLKDAEAAMTADRAFRRGLVVGPAEATGSAEMPAAKQRRSTLFGPATSELSPRELAAASTMYKHRLRTDAGLTAAVLDSMSHFFSHSPDLNLQLTAALATLALCPYRSLDGWLFPANSRPAVPTTLAELVAGDRRESVSDDGDDRSVDFDVEQLAKNTPITPPSWTQPSFLSSLTGSASSQPKVSDDSLLSILSALATSVAHYRAAINNFDQYLSERRQGLFFVENLTDALDLDDESGNAFGEAIRSLEASRAPTPAPVPEPATPVKAAPAPAPAVKPASGLGFGSFLSPKVTRAASSAFDAFSTPPRKSSQLSRSVSIDSFEAEQAPTSSGWTGTTSTVKGPASPFAAHYKQTGRISVKPVIVATPSALARNSVRAADFEDDGLGDESITLENGPPDSPTKRMSPAPQLASSTRGPPSSSVMSESGDGASDAALSEARKREVKLVTLSVILDNVIVLEEFIKELAGIVSVRASLGIDAVALF